MPPASDPTAPRPDAIPPATAPARPSLRLALGPVDRPAWMWALAALVVVSLVALLFPGIDLAVARLFHAPGVAYGTEFPAESVLALQSLRSAGMAVTRWATVLVVLALLAKIVAPLLARAIPTRSLLVVASSLALGPGLLVNAFFKELWGRPRPSETTLMGGGWIFKPAWIPGGDCPTNCSFPSGEASGAAWLLALVVVAPASWRRVALVPVLLWMAVISANRIAFGSHFLSDVLVGWTMMALVVTLAHELFVVRLSESALARIDGWCERASRAVFSRLGRRDLTPTN